VLHDRTKVYPLTYEVLRFPADPCYLDKIVGEARHSGDLAFDQKSGFFCVETPGGLAAENMDGIANSAETAAQFMRKNGKVLVRL
jgi:hypothetical protein